MAALEVLALDEATPQIRAPASADTYVMPRNLEIRNGATATKSEVYNTYTDASNYERGFMRWTSNILEIGTEKAGTGTSRNLRLLSSDGTYRVEVQVGVVSIVGVLRGETDNIRDLGQTAMRWRNLFLGNYQEMSEMTAPSAPGADKVRIYAEDNGSGKTRLMAIFPTGAAQQIAIEP